MGRQLKGILCDTRTSARTCDEEYPPPPPKDGKNDNKSGQPCMTTAEKERGQSETSGGRETTTEVQTHTGKRESEGQK